MARKGLTRGSLFCEIQNPVSLKQVFIKSIIRTRGLTPKMPFEVKFSPCKIENFSQSFSYIAFVFAFLNFFDASTNSQ